MIRLALRTLPVFAVIIGFAMALAAYMNFSGVRTAYLDLIRSRMAMIADDIAKDIQTANELGIRLSEQTTLPALLIRQAATDPLILSIDVVSDRGDTLFSSDLTRLGKPDDESVDAGAFRRVREVINNFGAPVGAVIVRLDRTVINGKVETLRLDIMADALPAGLGAVAGGSLVCLILLTLLHRNAKQSAFNPRDDDNIALAATELAQIEPRLQT